MISSVCLLSFISGKSFCLWLFGVDERSLFHDVHRCGRHACMVWCAATILLRRFVLCSTFCPVIPVRSRSRHNIAHIITPQQNRSVFSFFRNYWLRTSERKNRSVNRSLDHPRGSPPQRFPVALPVIFGPRAPETTTTNIRKQHLPPLNWHARHCVSKKRSRGATVPILRCRRRITAMEGPLDGYRGRAGAVSKHLNNGSKSVHFAHFSSVYQI